MLKFKKGSIVKIFGCIYEIGESDHGHLYVVNENNRKMFLYENMDKYVKVIQY